MNDEHNTITSGVPHVSESFGNERRYFSEGFGNVRKESEDAFGKLPNDSERNHTRLPNASEPFGNAAAPPSEGQDESLAHPPRRQVHTLTVREVEKLFEQAGRAVTERSILNWCKPNSEGTCRLNCGYERGERRWYIAPESVERVIEEERRKDQPLPKASLEFSEAQERLSETFGNDESGRSESFGNVRNISETSRIAVRHEEAQTERREVAPNRDEGHREQLDSLQKRIIELEREAAAGQYKDELITSLRERLNEDRRDYNDRMKFFQTQVEKLQTTTERYVEQLVGINRRVGELEAENRTLRQLPEGKQETSPRGW
jgi:hypothetical protein